MSALANSIIGPFTVLPSDPCAQTPAASARNTVWASDLPGFGLRTYASGKQAWVAHTLMQGRLRLVTLGSVAVLSPTQARKAAWAVLAQAHVGADPADARRAARTTPEFQLFLEAYWKSAEVRWKPSTRRTQGSYRRHHLDGVFAGRGVDEITHAEVLVWFREVGDRAGPGGANRVLDILSAAFMRAEAWGYRPDGSNPCRGVKKHRARCMERFLSNDELVRLGEALAAQPKKHEAKVAIIRLLVLTGCRVSEVAALRWQDVKGLRLNLPDAKTGPRTVWLGHEGRAVLDGLRRWRGQADVFYDPLLRRAPAALHHFWTVVCAEAGLTGVRMHDLRHTYASHAAALSETLPVIGGLLGHRRVATTGRYTHLDDANVLRVAEAIGVAIERLERGHVV
jgi:integrase